MNGSLGASVSSPSSAIIDRGDTSRAASAPPIRILLCMLIGSSPLDLLWLAKAWLVTIERLLFLFFSLIWDVHAARMRRAPLVANVKDLHSLYAVGLGWFCTSNFLDTIYDMSWKSNA